MVSRAAGCYDEDMPVLIPAIVVTAALFALYRYYPPFGGRPGTAHKKRASRSANFTKGKFVNYLPTSMQSQPGDTSSMIRDLLRKNPTSRPPRPLELTVPKHDANDTPQVSWLGHSTVLLRLQGKNILFDPVFGKAASPFTFAGPKRFRALKAIQLQDLPPIDVVCVSHDHYDHLDYFTVKRLKRTVRMFFVPLGVGAHLERWGVDAARITELDWWEESTFAGLRFACTPSRHFSGRTLTDRFKTLWCSWVVTDGKINLFFSGDTGYGPHFKKIGKRYGPFDLTLLECGQYDYRWPNVHMMPEQTAVAHADLRGKRLLPMHWGTFRLAFHGWSESVERVLVAAQKTGIQVTTPRIGETVPVVGTVFPVDHWWEAYKS